MQQLTLATELFSKKNKNIIGKDGGGSAQWLASRTTDQGVPCSRPGLVTVLCSLEQVTFFTPCLVLFKHRKPWT